MIAATSNPTDSSRTTPETVRAEVRAWLAAAWDPDLSLLEWRRRLLESGWAVPSWAPERHGRGLGAWADAIVSEELTAVGAVGTPVGGGMSLAAPTIVDHGPDRVRDRFLEPIITGEETWCQLFSEPGAGSDLAGITTRAERDGDRWILNGQKVWNTSADHADFGLLVARSNWDVPKHRGLTYFVLPMNQPGVEVRPLKQMNYHASFMEVFLTDAVVPAENVVGDVGQGWSVALTTLSYERRFASMGKADLPGEGRAAEEARAEAERYYQTYAWYPQRAGRVDLAVEYAHRAQSSDDPVIRQELARLISMQRVSQWTARRAAAARALGRPPGAEGSIGKLALSNLARQAARTHSLIGGADGMLSGADGAFDGMIGEVLISVPAQSIAGGTDEIQRNILGERILGLPREPSVDTDVAFRDVRRNA
ncbi:acyl-CoA dehydrogenase family protein [Ilumatobacter nonamiensis]|uniref:acyl-CoA dehydrogenase family protein n=1 Tax=Ilumatobacter nonamiensis TaxID=467093 RepID=UPI00034B13D6|nr:acyl-CoA dehydrogenase family protein [Ilumatobacter nonamiensis]